MPRADDPRVMVRLTPESYAVIKEAAEGANVAVGALVRECAERYAVRVAREVAAGSVRLRRAKVERASAAGAGRVTTARALVADSAVALAMERQRKLNAAAERARAKPGQVRGK
jgi:uncharacterized protein (DUF1778 family)